VQYVLAGKPIIEPEGKRGNCTYPHILDDEFPFRHPHNLLYCRFTAQIRHLAPLHVAGPPDFTPQRAIPHVPPVIEINFAVLFAVHPELHVFGYLRLDPHPSLAKVS
jgi:hypothetical protein